MRKAAFLVLASGLALAACTGPVNRGLESVNQPVVSHASYAFDLRRGDDGLAYGETVRLADWFAALRLGYGDRVAVDDAAGVPGARAQVADVTARFGLLLDDHAPVVPGQAGPDTVRVVVSRATADVPNCPNWSRPAQPEFAASTSSNYGCATNHNLAMMVANKDDLVHGQEATEIDPRVTARAIKAFRDNPATGAGQTVKAESSKGSN